LLHTVSLGLVLFGVWLLLSGHFSFLLLGLGIASTALVVYLARRMDLADHEGHPVHLMWRFVFYLPWLLKEIFKANIDVARAIIDPSLPISPVVLTVKGSQGGDLGHVAYANSITLTPGTVTIGLEDSVLTVHALTHDAGNELVGGEMDRRVTAMEGPKLPKGDEG
jgi:multicomponent Na+:H+ antiporter subunit E